MVRTVHLSSSTPPTLRHGHTTGRVSQIRKGEKLIRELALLESLQLLPKYTHAVINLEISLSIGPGFSAPEVHRFSEYRTKARFQLCPLVTQIRTSCIKDVELRVKVTMSNGNHLENQYTQRYVQSLVLPLLQLTRSVKFYVSGIEDGMKDTLFRTYVPAPNILSNDTALLKWLEVAKRVRESIDLAERAATKVARFKFNFKYLLASLCGSEKLGDWVYGPYSPDDYVEVEERHSKAAASALRLLSTGTGMWQRLREQSQAARMLEEKGKQQDQGAETIQRQ